MSEINVKVRSGTQTLYDTKVMIHLEETVQALKTKLCEKDDKLSQNMMEIVYCGNVMEDGNAIFKYDVFPGATLHVFKKTKSQKMPPAKVLNDGELTKLGSAFRSLSMNSTYRRALIKLTKPDVINHIVLTTPGLYDDPIGITLLQHSELLVKLNDMDVLKRISESHPALALAAIQIASAVQEEVVQNRITPDLLTRSMLNISDDDVDLDDSSPAYEARRLPDNAIPSFGTITSAQLASAIASVTTQQPQPSTSGASNSTPSTGLGDLTAQLTTMREMGLTNDALNREALRVSNDLETAIELVLSGFNISYNNSVSDDRSNV